MARWAMGKLDRIGTGWTADAFLRTDQQEFGDAWRYELVDGEIVAHAAPSPLHGRLIARIALVLGRRLEGHRCYLEVGSGAAPVDQQRATARIPDLTVRCGRSPRVLFEVVSPSELRDWRERNRRRRDEQDVEGVAEIVEIYQSQPAAHLYRKGADGHWMFEAVEDMDGVIHLRSLDLDLPLGEIYEGVDLTESE